MPCYLSGLMEVGLDVVGKTFRRAGQLAAAMADHEWVMIHVEDA